MNVILVMLAIQGTLGAFDTLYYHELRARLPAGGALTRPELGLHAARDALYAVIFGTLPWVSWRGGLSLVLLGLLAAEIVITLADFVIEDRVRAPLGGVFPGERVMHTVMAILYGAILSRLLPEMGAWWGEATGFGPGPEAPTALRLLLSAMGAGVLLSGARDLAAALGVPGASWPWHPAPDTRSPKS